MDFGTIRGNLLGELYDDPSEVIADIKLVFTNCYLYNHEKTVSVKHIKHNFEVQYQKWVKWTAASNLNLMVLKC